MLSFCCVDVIVVMSLTHIHSQCSYRKHLLGFYEKIYAFRLDVQTVVVKVIEMENVFKYSRYQRKSAGQYDKTVIV